tara:strand:- start:180 stop:542 length:363 start_codon:yes stop_codon:yes gene_type:complete
MSSNKILERIEKTKEKVKQFSELLDSIDSLEDKKKSLWKEIYENSISDRENAFILFSEAYTSMSNTASEHISVGPILNKYLERMNKSNEQLIKLAELLSKAEENATKIDPEDIFSKIGGD